MHNNGVIADHRGLEGFEREPVLAAKVPCSHLLRGRLVLRQSTCSEERHVLGWAGLMLCFAVKNAAARSLVFVGAWCAPPTPDISSTISVASLSHAARASMEANK